MDVAEYFTLLFDRIVWPIQKRQCVRYYFNAEWERGYRWISRLDVDLSQSK
jgi:hypothetical protein